MDHVELANLGKEAGHSIGSSECDASGPIVAPLNHGSWLEDVRAYLVHAPMMFWLWVAPEAEGQHVLVLACPQVLGLIRLKLDKVIVCVAQVDRTVGRPPALLEAPDVKVLVLISDHHLPAADQLAIRCLALEELAVVLISLQIRLYSVRLDIVNLQFVNDFSVRQESGVGILAGLYFPHVQQLAQPSFGAVHLPARARAQRPGQKQRNIASVGAKQEQIANEVEDYAGT